MKKYLILIVCVTITINALAQPSDATVKAKATSNGSKFVEFVGEGKIHSNLTETWYIRVAVTKQATEHAGINYISAKEYKYKKSGGSWVFDRTYHWWSEYEGIPNPTQEEAVAMVETDLRKFLGGSYGDIVSEVGAIKLAPEPKWEWHTMQSVSFIMETSFDKKVSSTEVASVTQQYKVRFYADEFKGPWKRFISSNNGIPKTRETKTYTAEELRAMPTLMDLEYEKQAKAATAHLPEVEIPDFKNGKELIVHTHNMLRTSSRDQMHAYLLKTFSSRNYAENSKYVLSDWGERRLEDVLSRAFDGNSKYKDQYCEHPVVKHEQENMMELWNKLNDRKTRIAVVQEDGVFKINDIQAYVYLNDADARAAEAGNKCGEPIATAAPEITQFSIGEGVEVQSRANWIPGTVTKKDDVFDNRYYVDYTNSGGSWVNADVMRKASGTAPTEEPATDTESTLVPTESTPNKTSEKPVETTKKKPATNKAKSKLKSLKGKVKLP